MRQSWWPSFLGLGAVATLVSADVEIVYVTDLEIFTLLAPCAASAISYAAATRTMYTQCPEDETGLQSCICSSTAGLESFKSDLESDVSYSCGETATDDQASASSVLVQYCNPDTTVTFSTPTENIVHALITDLAEMEYLAPCAQSALSYAVMGAGSHCPEDASLYAPCVCNKDIVTSAVSETLSSSVRYSCSNTQDVTSAENFYHEYCAMNEGTTSFKKPDGPPGNMTYYVTGLPHYQSLRECAQSAVSSAIDAQTAWLCPEGPQALASCACLKSGMRSAVSSILSTEVKYYCDNTATADVTSALDVLDVYCSAAASETVINVQDSATESAIPSRTDSGTSDPEPTDDDSDDDDDSDGGAGGSDGESGGSRDGGDSDEEDGGDGGGDGVNLTATIVGSVLGGVIVMALVLGGWWFFRRRQRKKNGQQLSPADDGHSGPPELSEETRGPKELGGYGKDVSPQISSVSPAHLGSAELYSGPNTPPVSELPPQQEAPRELAANPYGQQYPYQQPVVSPMGSDGNAASPFGGSPHPGHTHPSVSPTTPSNGQGMGWQSGPVESYELDSNIGRRQG